MVESITQTKMGFWFKEENLGQPFVVSLESLCIQDSGKQTPPCWGVPDRQGGVGWGLISAACINESGSFVNFSNYSKRSSYRMENVKTCSQAKDLHR